MKRFFLVVIVCDKEGINSELCTELDRMGYAPIGFGNLVDLVFALNKKDGGFDVAFFVFQRANINELLALIRRASILLFIGNADWNAIPSDLSEIFKSKQTIDVIEGESPSLGQVKWRIQSLLARMSLKSQSASLASLSENDGSTPATAYHFSNIGTVVQYGGKRVRLSRLQYELTLLMFENHGKTLKRSMLNAKFWPGRPQSRSLDCCVSAVRKSLELDGSKGALLETIYGQGYRLSLGTPLETTG